MRYLLTVLLAFCCAAATAQPPNPFARPSAQPSALPNAAPQPSVVGFPGAAPAPVNFGPGSTPPVGPNGMMPPPGWGGANAVGIPTGGPGMPGPLPDRNVVQEVPVKRIGTVNGIAVLRGENTYMFEKEKKLNFTRVPQLGENRAQSSREGAGAEQNNRGNVPTYAPGYVGGPVSATQH